MPSPPRFGDAVARSAAVTEVIRAALTALGCWIIRRRPGRRGRNVLELFDAQPTSASVLFQLASRSPGRHVGGTPPQRKSLDRSARTQNTTGALKPRDDVGHCRPGCRSGFRHQVGQICHLGCRPIAVDVLSA